jgi:hypothetical protein
LAFLHALAEPHEEPGGVTVDGADARAVIEKDDSTVSALPSGEIDDAVAGGVDR